MATPSDILGLKIQESGDTSWGPTTEANLERIEEAIASETAVSTTGGTTTLTTTSYIANQSRPAILRITGTLASNATIVYPVPASARRVFVINATTGNYTVVVKFGSSGTEVTVRQGYCVEVFSNAAASTYVVSPQISITTGMPYVSGATTRDQPVSLGDVDDRIVTILDRNLTTPPGSPAVGDCYYVATGGSGSWSGQDGKLARYASAGWVFSDLVEGQLLWISDEAKLFVFDDPSLFDLIGGGGIADGGVTEAKLASSAVTTAKIADSAVTSAKIPSEAVTAANLNPDCFASEADAKAGTSATVAITPSVAVHASFPTGTRMIFQQTSAPTGWTKDTATTNAALRLTSGSAGSGGSVNFTGAFASRSLSGTVGNTTLTEAQMPAHTHYQYSDLATTDVTKEDITAATVPAWRNNSTGDKEGYQMRYNNTNPTTAVLGLTSSAGGGSSHTHTLSMTALNLDVKYVDVIIAVKD